MCLGTDFVHENREREHTYYHGPPVAHLAWKKGVCRGRTAFDISFQLKTTLSLKSTIDQWILWCCQSIIWANFCRYTVYWQYLLI